MTGALRVKSLLRKAPTLADDNRIRWSRADLCSAGAFLVLNARSSSCEQSQGPSCHGDSLTSAAAKSNPAEFSRTTLSKQNLSASGVVPGEGDSKVVSEGAQNQKIAAYLHLSKKSPFFNRSTGIELKLHPLKDALYQGDSDQVEREVAALIVQLRQGSEDAKVRDDFVERYAEEYLYFGSVCSTWPKQVSKDAKRVWGRVKETASRAFKRQGPVSEDGDVAGSESALASSKDLEILTHKVTSYQKGFYEDFALNATVLLNRIVNNPMRESATQLLESSLESGVVLHPEKLKQHLDTCSSAIVKDIEEMIKILEGIGSNGETVVDKTDKSSSEEIHHMPFSAPHDKRGPQFVSVRLDAEIDSEHA